MSFRERLFIGCKAHIGGKDSLLSKLHPDAQTNLGKILDKRRSTFWGETPVVFRSRKYKHAGEVRDERVAVIKPQIHTVKLYSVILRKKVEIKTTPQMLRYIEAWGGLDDYLLQTPDRKLRSDTASTMKWKILQLYQAKQMSSSAELVMSYKRGLDSERTARSMHMLQPTVEQEEQRQGVEEQEEQQHEHKEQQQGQQQQEQRKEQLKGSQIVPPAS